MLHGTDGFYMGQPGFYMGQPGFYMGHIGQPGFYMGHIGQMGFSWDKIHRTASVFHGTNGDYGTLLVSSKYPLTMAIYHTIL